MLGAGICLQMCLKIRHFLTFYERRGFNHFLYPGVYILLDSLILRLQVNHLNFFLRRKATINFVFHCSKINSTTPG